MAGDPKPIRLVKKVKRAGIEPLAKVVVAERRHDWSKAIQSWIKDFRRNDRQESLAEFDSLFKEELNPESELPVKKGACGAEAE